MSLYDKITDLVDEELEHRVNAIINEYAEIISKKHCIALDLLLRDIPKVHTGSVCKGTKTNGQRYTFRGVHEGYCRHHTGQRDRLKQRTMSCSSIHNHGPEQMFVRGCPGCEAPNELIDFDSII
jgi:hypothetical protein